MQQHPYIMLAVQAFRVRMPDAIETVFGDTTYLSGNDRQFVLSMISMAPGLTELQCLDTRTGAELCIRGDDGDDLIFYATASVRMNAMFEACANFQEAVDRFLECEDRKRVGENDDTRGVKRARMV